MPNRGALTRFIAAAGGVVVLVSILSVVVTRDVLTPMALAPLVWVGGASLSYAALRAQARLRVVVTGFGITVGSLVLGLPLRGLLGGSAQVQYVAAVALIVLYYVGLAIMLAGALLLLKDLFKPPSQAEARKS